MFKIYCILFLYFNLFKLLLMAVPLEINLQADAAVLMDAETGVLLFQKEAQSRRYPASTTKVATALYALQKKQHELDKVVVADSDSLATIQPQIKVKGNYSAPSYWLETDGCHIGIQKDEAFTLHDLLRGTLIVTANDAANLVAREVSGSIPQFMDELNQFLKELGCQHTHFCNPHGLHHPNHYTTAYDLAIMAQAALKNPIFREIVAQPSFIRPKTNKRSTKATLPQTNRLLRPGKFFYSKAIGIKTGYHSKAKHNFVGAARSGDRTLIAVLLGYKQRSQLFEEAIKLFDTAFNQPKLQKVFLKKGPQKFEYQLPNGQHCKTHLLEDLAINYYLAEEPSVKCFLTWNSLELPIQQDQEVGRLELITEKGNILKTLPLLASEEVLLPKKDNQLLIIGASLAMMCGLIWLLKKRKDG